MQAKSESGVEGYRRWERVGRRRGREGNEKKVEAKSQESRWATEKRDLGARVTGVYEGTYLLLLAGTLAYFLPSTIQIRHGWPMGALRRTSPHDPFRGAKCEYGLFGGAHDRPSSARPPLCKERVRKQE